MEDCHSCSPLLFWIIVICFLSCLRVVPITEASVAIVASSPHRKESLEAIQYGIDTLKATVPIWKKVEHDGISMEKKYSVKSKNVLPEYAVNQFPQVAEILGCHYQAFN